MSDAHLTQYQALPLDEDRLTLDKSLAINPTILPLDDDPEEPCHDYLEMLDIIQPDLPDRHSSLLEMQVSVPMAAASFKKGPGMWGRWWYKPE